MNAVLITGATDGLGRALATHLAADGHELILHGRDADRLAAVADSLPGTHQSVLADLAELAQVRRLAAKVREATTGSTSSSATPASARVSPMGGRDGPVWMVTSCGSR